MLRVGGIMMNLFQDRFFHFRFRGDLNLLYCGNRENSLNHKYTHTQKAYLLTYVAEGSATLSAKGKRIPLKKGDFYVMFPASGVSYVTGANKPWSIRWVTLTGSQLDELLPLMGFSPSHPVTAVTNPQEVEEILKELFFIALKEDLKSKLSALSLLYRLLGAVSKSESTAFPNKTVSEAVDYVAEHFSDEKLTVEALAARAFLNPNYFSKLFAKHVGIPPAKFILKTRMEKAKNLLRFTHLPISDIALSVGFSDPLYFSRAFHRFAGLSPTQYRSLE